MSGAGLFAFGVLCFFAGAIITLAVCARWAWLVMEERMDAPARTRCVECGKQDVPLYDGECIPCRFGRDVPAVGTGVHVTERLVMLEELDAERLSKLKKLIENGAIGKP